jgi:hypothetical protein
MIRKYTQYENYEDHRINKDRINDLTTTNFWNIYRINNPKLAVKKFAHFLFIQELIKEMIEYYAMNLSS